jgi:hypothetical protein
MISTLYAKAVVSTRDRDLMHHLRRLTEPPDEGTATIYRLGIANNAGELYRLIIVFGLDERCSAVELLRTHGYRQLGPNLERGLDAIFLQPAEGRKTEPAMD